MLRAVAALDGQNVGTYQATVTVEYYAAENGQTVTKKLTQSAEVIFQQDEQIIFYLDCPSACIDATRFTVLQRNSAGELEIASNATIGLGMQSNPSRFTVEYGLRTPDEQKKLLCCHPVQRRQRQRYAGRDRRGIAGRFGWPDAADQR